MFCCLMMKIVPVYWFVPGCDKACARLKDKRSQERATTEPLDGVWAPRLQDLVSPQGRSSVTLCPFAGQDLALTGYV